MVDPVIAFGDLDGLVQVVWIWVLHTVPCPSLESLHERSKDDLVAYPGQLEYDCSKLGSIVSYAFRLSEAAESLPC